jgi:RNA polymerase sigma factor (TIGR02999 family)
MSDFTEVLQRARAGEHRATEQLIPLVYNELRALAASRMARESPGQTLQPTALVHEAWLRLGGEQMPLWENRSHFFAAASEAMRRILIDRARKVQVRRAAGLGTRESIDDSRIQLQAPEGEIIEINQVLDRLTMVDSRAAELVKLRYFVGLTMSEAAKSLGLSLRNAERLWTFAKAWLRDAIRRDA